MSVIETTATEAPTVEVPAQPAAVPAVVEQPAQVPAVAGTSNALWQIANRVARTEMVPKALHGRPEAAFAVMLYGNELGLGPMQSLQSIHFIEGKPSQSADLMRSTVLRHGHTIDVREWTREKCVLYGKRKDDGTDLIVEYTVDDAKDANLLHKDVWKKFRKDMLLARATTQLCRAKFSDCLSGVIYTPEELEDVVVEDGPPRTTSGSADGAQGGAPEETPHMSDSNQRAFTAQAEKMGRTAVELALIVLKATDGRTCKVSELFKSELSPLRDAMFGWPFDDAELARLRSLPAFEAPVDDAEVDAPPPAETNTFATAGRARKARTIADWLIANEVNDSDGSLTAATVEERRAIGESAGVANKAGTPPSDETWALVLDMVRQHQPAPAGDAFQGVAP